MPSVYDLYEFYLDAHDLKDKAHLVKVESVRADSMINPRSRKPEKKLVLRFVNRRKTMILNKTQAGAMTEISGTDDYTKWVGTEVVLMAGRAINGKDTIIITTRENSGDIDLMYPKSSPVPTESGKVNVPTDWWNALSDEAVTFAADTWKIEKKHAITRLDLAIKGEALSILLPKVEFMEYVRGGCVK